ncbi:MAG TPA: YDG domain-containing protein [Gemmatimonadales bacterium]|nr:YDG domain-containing protein [Gemmatimonadales bacterium]
MSKITRAWVAALALAAGLSLPASLAAQKALVYCPVSIDAAGCGAIVAALGADTTLFPGGIDGAYDGTQGTMDLATVDLAGYAVLLVPSLADGAGTTPYALLRDPTIAARIKQAFMGRVAVWSGTPDVGSTNRTAKDNLIRNLARWVRPDSAGSHGPGVVVLQDNSDEMSLRYGWLGAISSASVAADSTFTVYSNVQVLTQAGSAILTSGGVQIGYTNMATFALLPAAGTSSDATGGRTSAVVLATIAGEPSDPNIATVQTDREDYFPPDTVIVTGAGWEPGETVRLVIQEDASPSVHPEVSLTTVADDAGHILDQQFAIDSAAIGVRFTLTATGQTSGRTAQATFTDNTGLNSVTILGTQSPTPLNPPGSATYGTVASNSVQVRFNGNGSCTVALSVSGLPSGASSTLVPSTLTGTSSGNQFSLLTVNTTGAVATGTSTIVVRATGTGGSGNDCSTSITQTATTTLVVKRASTTTVSGPASSTFGASVTFTATVAGGPSPTGTVQFKDGGVNLGAPQTISGGTASVSTSTLTGGAHTITAVYSGDANFDVSTSPNFSHTVDPASTTTVLSSSVNPSNFGQSISLSASVSGPAGTGTPTGSIQFKIDGSNFGSPVTLSAGVAASGSTNSLAVGAHPVAAVYTPDAPSAPKFASSTSTVIATQTVNQALSTTTLTSSVNPSVFGQSITLTATVKNGATPITVGSISFIEGGTCTTPGTSLQSNQTPSAAGVVTYTANNLSVAAHSVLACYDGSGSFGPSEASFTQTVNKAATSTTITSDTPDPSDAGQPVAVNFAVTASPPGSGTPGGNVTVSASGGTETCTGTVAAGTCSITLTGSGPRTLTAAYAGDASFAASTSATAAHTVRAPATVLTVAPASGIYGATAALSATLTSGGNPVPGKSIGFSLNGSSAGSATTNASGVASIAAASLAAIDAGVYSTGVAASFAGDAGFTASNGTNTLTVSTATVTPVITVSNKAYDGTTTATIVTRSLTGVVGTDDVTLTGGSATFDSKTAGNGKTVSGTGFTLAGTDASNYVLSATFAITTADITPLTLTGHVTANDKGYDGTTAAVLATRTLTGVLPGDAVTLTGGNATFDTKDIGTGKTVTATTLVLSGADAGNYVLASTTVTTTADITSATVTGHFTVSDKLYDGTTSATILTRTLTGVVSGEAVSLTGGSASFGSKSVGTGKTVTGTGFSLAGAAAGNYLLASSTLTTTAGITPATVAGHITANDKVYDGTDQATLATRTLTGVIGTDNVSLTGGTPTFSDKQVGSGKTVTATSLGLSGGDAGNYVLASSTLTTTADITVRTLTATATAQDKVYDGTAAATVTLGDDRVVGDALTLGSGTPTFDDRNVGTGKTITVSGLTLSGTDAGNYVLASTTVATTADIMPATVTGHFTAASKVYNGSPAAAIATRTLTGVIGTDDVSLSGGSSSFANKHVGVGKTVAGTGFSLAGTDAGNYELASSTLTASADITARTLAVTATGHDKVYDATTAATVTLQDDRVAGDVFSVTYGSATFVNKQVGNGKPVSVIGIAIGSGADAGDYQLGNTTTAAAADITPASLAPHITASDKVYDGTSAATIATRSLTGILASDVVTLTGGAASFGDKNVGTGKNVTGTGFTLASADAGNYVLDPTSATTSADITTRPLVATATGHDRVYDATTAATVTLGDNRVAGDDITLSYSSANFDTKNVGNGKPVSVSGIGISGADAGNYDPTNSTASTTASITQAALAPHITASDKVYDGTPVAAILTRSLTGVLLSDDVSLSDGTASFADKNVGTTKSVTASGFGLSGGDAGNYALVPATATTTASISQRPIAVAADAKTKVYGNADPSLTYHLTSGSLVGGDAFTGGLFRLAGETVPGSPYAINQGTLTAGGNYALAFTPASLAITQATLTVTANSTSKTFGNAVPAPLTGSIVGVKFSDNISATYTAYIATGGLALVTPTTGVSGSPYPIIPEVSGSPSGVLSNYEVVLVNGGLTVQKATPSFNSLAIPNVVVGQGSSTVSGNLKYLGTAATVFPSGAASITVNGQTQPATIQASGNFTATFTTSAFPPSGTGLTVALSYNGSDPNFTTASGAGAMKVLYNVAAGHSFLQPINPNLTTGNRSSFKIGSTIPTKFQLFKADGTTPITSAVATIAVVKLDNTAETPINEDLITSPADDGINFRPSSGQFIFNLSTKNWTAGTYRIIANLDDGSQITAEVDGRSK